MSVCDGHFPKIVRTNSKYNTLGMISMLFGQTLKINGEDEIQNWVWFILFLEKMKFKIVQYSNTVRFELKISNIGTKIEYSSSNWLCTCIQ